MVPQGDMARTSTKSPTTNHTTPPSAVPQDELGDELEPWVDHTVRATHNADNLLAAKGISSWILRQSRTNWKQSRMIAKPRRTLARTHLQMEPSDINRTERVSEARDTSQEMARRHHILAINQSSQRQQRSHERIAAQDGLKWDSMASDTVSNRLKQPIRPTPPDRHDNDSQANSRRTNNARDQSPRPRRRRR